MAVSSRPFRLLIILVVVVVTLGIFIPTQMMGSLLLGLPPIAEDIVEMEGLPPPVEENKVVVSNDDEISTSIIKGNTSDRTISVIDNTVMATTMTTTTPPTTTSAKTTSIMTGISDIQKSVILEGGAINRTVLAYPVDLWPNRTTATTNTNTWPWDDLNLKIYLYDTSTWPEELRVVRNCRIEQLINVTMEPYPSNDNRISDVGLIQLFETYPQRVYDPSLADVFVVPYPHASHCFSSCLRGGSYQPNCGGVQQSLIDTLIDDHLTWFHGRNIERHLFLLSTSHMLNRKLQMAPLKFVIGPRIYKLDQTSTKYLPRMNPRHHENFRQQLGTFIIPYMNTHPWMQPSIIRSRPSDWWTRPRTYSFVYLFGGRNKRTKDDPRIHRRRFERYMVRKNYTTIGGKPFLLQEQGTIQFSPEDTFHLYQESVFCPCLPGDTVTQKRFYDVILNGCIPVVLRFPHGGENGNNEPHEGKANASTAATTTTWHPFENSRLEASLPFAHPDQYHGDLDLLINYTNIVIEVDLPASNLAQAMIDWLAPERANALKDRQNAMKAIAPLLTYGLGPLEAHQSDDAFSRLLRGLKHYLDGLSS